MRKQLISVMNRYKTDVATAGRNYNKLRRAIASGYFMLAAEQYPREGYRVVVQGNHVYIHPSSALFNKSPRWVIYRELVLTTKEVHARRHDHRAEMAREARPAVLQGRRPYQDEQAEENAENWALVRQVRNTQLVAPQQANGIAIVHIISDDGVLSKNCGY